MRTSRTAVSAKERRLAFRCLFAVLPGLFSCNAPRADEILDREHQHRHDRRLHDLEGYSERVQDVVRKTSLEETSLVQIGRESK